MVSPGHFRLIGLIRNVGHLRDSDPSPLTYTHRVAHSLLWVPSLVHDLDQKNQTNPILLLTACTTATSRSGSAFQVPAGDEKLDIPADTDCAHWQTAALITAATGVSLDGMGLSGYPCLDDRKEDIPALVLRFLKLHAGKHTDQPTTTQLNRLTHDPTAIRLGEVLAQRTWPGNVRQLEKLSLIHI